MTTLSKQLPRVCPWTTEEEFKQVHHWLYAPATDPTSQELGVKRVRAWSARGRVPHAAEHTASFIEVGLRDRYGSLTQHELRLMYSMCFIRCINDLVDQEQKSTHAQSVQNLADRLGLPSWFAELRHAGTHDALPSLQVLRTAITQALGWLEENYWSVQQNLTSECIQDLRPLLLQYKDYQKRTIRSETAMKEEQEEADGREKLDQLASLMIGASPHREAFILLLLEPGFLVPIGKRKRATIEDMTLPHELKRLWDPLLVHLSQVTWPSVWDDLAIAIVDRLEWTEDPWLGKVEGARAGSKSVSQLATLTAWLRHWIGQHQDRAQPVKLTGYEDLLEACLRLPSPFTRSVVEQICQGEEGEQLAEQLGPVLEYMDQMFTGMTPQMIRRIDTEGGMIEEIEKEVKAMEQLLAQQRSRKTESGVRKEDEMEEGEEEGRMGEKETVDVWRMYGEGGRMEGDEEQTEWKECPLGCLPNGQIPDLSLPLEMDYPSSRR
ncbi:MAG: Las1-like-domain-containing protein [Piptocephalis tieghemiana]|nr:MAG: Las1-like-domain-containing protein [Piptocephalis tieghemiana]